MIISTNILSVYSKEDFDYIVTPSAQAVSSEISTSLEKRYRCLSLIGSYGTGKSSFLYALINSIQGNSDYFPDLRSREAKVFKSIGQFESFLTHIGRLLKVSADVESICLALKKVDESNRRVYIFIDEFGKLIEYALKNEPKRETYYFQQIAEFINNELEHTVLISTLHQSFESYSHNVGSADITEWEKVSGRFHSITFNEPIETVAEIVVKHFAELFSVRDNLMDMTKIACNLNLIPDVFLSSILNCGSIGNMDGLTSYIAISVFRKYAQNERSVFTFLNDPSSCGIMANKDSNFTLPELYDYILNRFAHVIYSSVNPDKLQWESAERAIQRADSHDELSPDISHRIIKTIHLVNLFAREAGKFNSMEFLTYMTVDGTGNFESELNLLFDKNILHYVNYKGRLTFVEGTDVNLEIELRKASGKLVLNADYDQELKKIITIDPLLSKHHLFRTGTPRLWFTSIQSDKSEPKELRNVLSTNGLILIQFNKGVNDVFELNHIPVVVCTCEIVDVVKNLIERIRKFEIVIEEYRDDNVVRNLLQLELDFATRELKSELMRQLYSTGKWEYEGRKLNISSSRSLNSELSKIFDAYYSEHPIVINELINRGRLSASINTARKRLFDALICHAGDLLFEKGKYPPERMIFESTLEREGMVDAANKSLLPNTRSSYSAYWSELDRVLEESRYQKRPFSDFVDRLSAKPYGMKAGLLKFLLSYFIIANKDAFALTHEPSSKFLPYLHSDSLESMFLKPYEFYLKKYNFDRVPRKAIDSLLKFSRIEGAIQISAERSAFFGIYAQLSRSIDQLPSYTRKTKVGLDPKSLKLRDAIENAKDPESALLIDMPIGIGFKPLTEQSDLEYVNFFDQLEVCVTDLTSAFPRLVYGLKNHFLELLGGTTSDFGNEKEFIREFISTINVDLLGERMNIIIKRLLSPLDDEILFWKATLDAIAEFNIEEITDEQVDMVKLKISSISDALQSLVGMVGSKTANTGISITFKDGSSKRKFSSAMTDQEVIKSHASVLGHFNALDARTRINLLTYLVQKEL